MLNVVNLSRILFFKIVSLASDFQVVFYVNWLFCDSIEKILCKLEFWSGSTYKKNFEGFSITDGLD